MIQPLVAPIAAPDLALEGMDGHLLHLSDLRGRVVFLNFWATWCGPCRQEMPAMERLHRTFERRGLAVLAVNFGESRSDLQEFTRALSLSFPVALDAQTDAAHAMGIRGLPVSILLDRDGRILWKALGSREWDSPVSRAYFEKLLELPRQ